MSKHSSAAVSRVAYQGSGLRVVSVDGVDVVEVVDRLDSTGAPMWRRVETSSGLQPVVGWTDIAVAAKLQPGQWRMVFNASRRATRPLCVDYDAWNRPFTYECVIRDWLNFCRRPAWAYDMEQRMLREQREERERRDQRRSRRPDGPGCTKVRSRAKSAE